MKEDKSRECVQLILAKSLLIAALIGFLIGAIATTLFFIWWN